MALEKELAVFQRDRAGWVREGKSGQWVVIHGEEVVGFYRSLDEALRAGYDRCGPDELFMAREVSATDALVATSRRAVHVPRRP